MIERHHFQGSSSDNTVDPSMAPAVGKAPNVYAVKSAGGMGKELEHFA